MSREELESRIQTFVGKAIGPPDVARDAVSEGAIRQWCDAMLDSNPVYLDPQAAEESVFGGLVAPPTMLQAWSLKGIEMARPDPDAPKDLQQLLHAVFNEYGYVGVVATNCDQQFDRYLKPGDRVTATTVIESISEQKATGLGIGYFINTRLTFVDQDGEQVGSMTFRVLKYKPAKKPTASEDSSSASTPAQPKRMRPAIGHDNAWWWEQGVANEKLLIQKCESCGELRHPPRPMCPHCQSLEWGSIEASGKATVHSYVLMYYPEFPPFEYPHAVGVFDLEEGTRFVSNLVTDDLDAIEIGMPVELYFEQVDDELTLPLFRPVKR
jgi:uncharacterized OB-fold protein/acyl dehydratase